MYLRLLNQSLTLNLKIFYTAQFFLWTRSVMSKIVFLNVPFEKGDCFVDFKLVILNLVQRN